MDLLKSDSGTKYVTTLTSEAFASGAYDPATKKHAASLLPELNSKCLATRDLTAVLSLNPERVKKFLGDVGSAFDKAFNKAIGTGFGGSATLDFDSTFSWVACVTPEIAAKHQRYMAQLGTRFLRYRLPQLTKKQTEAGFDLASNPKGQQAARAHLRQLVHEHLADVGSHLDESVVIPETYDRWLRDLSLLVAKGRTLTHPELVFGDGDKWSKEWVLGESEDPYRAYHQLRTMLESLTRVRGRSTPTVRDLALVRQVALDSMLDHYRQVLEALVKDPVCVMHTEWVDVDGNTEPMDCEDYGLTVERCGDGINKTYTHAWRLLDQLVELGVMVKRYRDIKGPTKPEDLYVLAPGYEVVWPPFLTLPEPVANIGNWRSLTQAEAELPLPPLSPDEGRFLHELSPHAGKG